MNTWCDMVSFTAQFMATSIERKDLDLSGVPGEVAWLKRAGCTVRLTNIDNDYVRFEFWSPTNEAQVFEFLDYLNCVYELRGRELRPLPPKELNPEEKFEAMLKTYDKLLCEGYFDVPLAGDFGWVPSYHAMLSEMKKLSLVRLDLEDAGHPEAEAILLKEIRSDYSWMDDVRRILAEQEAKP
jgi:hypothetical protein